NEIADKCGCACNANRYKTLAINRPFMARAAAKALNLDVKVFMCVSYVTGCDLSLGPHNTAMAVPVAGTWLAFVFRDAVNPSMDAAGKTSCFSRPGKNIDPPSVPTTLLETRHCAMASQTSG